VGPTRQGFPLPRGVLLQQNPRAIRGTSSTHLMAPLITSGQNLSAPLSTTRDLEPFPEALQFRRALLLFDH
jgi:hypothetical protein